MATIYAEMVWPEWVTIQAFPREFKVRAQVRHNNFAEVIEFDDFPMERSAMRDAIYEAKRHLIRQQETLNAVTRRLKS